VSKRTVRRHALFLALTICAGGLVVGTTAALAGSTFTWSGEDSSSSNWSLADNWGSTAPSAGESGDSLVFPANLSGGDCANATPDDACYTAEDDLAGYAVNSLSIDDGDGYYIAPDNTQDPLTIGSGGITATTSSSTFNPAEFGLPIILGAPQSWQVNGGPDGTGQLNFDSGLSGSSTLGIDVGDQGFVDLDDDSNSEVGNVTVGGASSGSSGTTAADNGALELDGSKLNATDGNSIALDNATLLGSGTVGNLTVDGGQVAPGEPAGVIAVDGNVTFSENSTFGYPAFTPLIIDAGTTPGTDSSVLTATGTVNLGFTTLDIEAGNDTNSCPTLNFGAVYTLISAQSIVGALSGEGGDSTMDCTGSNAPVFSIADDTSSSPETVTATVVGPGTTTYTSLDEVAPDPPESGRPLTLAAIFNAYAPTTDASVTPLGTVEFESGGTPIAGCTSQPLIQGAASPLSPGEWQATCTTTASETVGPYSYQAKFNPTDPQTGGQLPSTSSPSTGQIAAWVLDGGTPAVDLVSTHGLIATLPLICDGLTGQLCSDVTARLSVKETLKGRKVVAVTAGVTQRATKRTVVLGSGSTTLGVDDKATLHLHLNGTGQALLKAHHSLTAELTITDDGSVDWSQTLKFTDPEAKKAKR
jgi:hypothetical protein